jgi:hypothetical protein
VFTIVADPIGSGFAASLARPGGNVTGISNTDPAIGSKWVGLLKEIAPRTDRVALLTNPATASALQSLSSCIQAAASSLAVLVSDASVRDQKEIEGIFASQAHNAGGGVIVMPGAFVVVNRELIIELAARYNVPTIYPDLFFAESGGLIAYGADFADQFRLAAGYIDRILKGTKPADLPIEHRAVIEHRGMGFNRLKLRIGAATPPRSEPRTGARLSVKCEDPTFAACYHSLGLPRARGASDDNHHWTAGADSCARRGAGVAVCGARAASERADHRRAGHWQYKPGRILAGVSAGTTRSRVYRGTEHSI